jgi:DNA-binding MurR/RpiR family transcriptional regulator
MKNRSAGTRSRGQAPGATLEVRFAQARHRLNARRQKLVEAILEGAEETFFLSSRDLAKRLDVDAATIVRTIQALGYERYADFSADLRRYFLAKITPYAVLKAETKQGRSLDEHIRRSLERDLENLTALQARLDLGAVAELARQIHRARHILVVGVDLAASLSWLLAYALVPLGFDAEAPVGSSGNLQHKVRALAALARNDLLVAISFGRCLHDTVEAVKRARARSVPTFGITDSPVTPIARYCDRYLLATTGSPLYTGSYAAPVALINAILMACSQTRASRALARLRQTEEEYFSGGRYYQEPERPRASAP